MKLKLTWLLTLFMAFVMQFSFAQEKTVTGTVTTAGDGLPLPGATVIVKGTTRGAQTDFDGKYSISVSTGEVLSFSYVGMKAVEVKVGASNTYDVKLELDNALEEVIVTGYGKSMARAKSTTSSVQVTAEGIENRPNTNVLTSLQGQAAGVQIASSSGQPGTNKINVTIRGNASILSSSDPLYVVDGVPLTEAFFRNLNPNEIESVNVLKDAAATAVYGNRGSNGVIVITTKRGYFSESLSVGYSTSYGYTNFIEDDYNMGSSRDQLRLQQLGFAAGVGVLGSALGVDGGYFEDVGGDFLISVDPNNLDAFDINTDWQDEFFRTGITQSHDLSFTAGGEKYRNYTSVGYFEQEGIVPGTNFQRFTLRNNFDGKSLNEKFNYSVRLFGAYSDRNQLEQETRGGINNNVLQNPLTGYLSSSRFLPIEFYTNGQDLFDTFGNPALDLVPYMLLDLFKPNSQNDNRAEYQALINVEASYDITDNLNFGIISGADYRQELRGFNVGPESYLSIVRASGNAVDFDGIETLSDRRTFTFNHINRLTYNNTFGDDHTLDVSAYTEYTKAHYRFNFGQQRGLNPLTWEPGAGTGYIPYNPDELPLAYAPSVGATKIEAGLFSYFGTLDYDYKGKYGFFGSVRRDGSYRFVNDFKWGTFWSVSGRWNITEEGWFDNTDIVNDLKLRVSYGTSGNQNITGRGADSGVADIFQSPQLTRDLNALGTGINNLPSFFVSSIANTELRWETTTQFNVGLDFGLLDRKLTGSVDYYNRLTEDLFQGVAVSASTGISQISANDGSIRNSGFEVNLDYSIFREGKFKLNVFGNIGYNVDEFVELGSADSDGDGSFRPGDDFIRNEGGQLSEYFLVPYRGVNPANGNLLFEDINGNLTEAPTDADRRATGKSLFPVYQGGFGFRAEYDGFFLNTLFVYAADQYRFDSNYNGLMDIRNAGDFPVSNDLFNAWTPDNRNTGVPGLGATNLDSQNLSDRFLVDASYLRLRNVTLGYSFPQRFLEDIFINKLTFRVVAENFFTWTKWKGLDPERPTAGEAIGFFPTPKVLTVGMDINF